MHEAADVLQDASAALFLADYYCGYKFDTYGVAPVNVDIVRAIEYYKAAINGGHVDALLGLGSLYIQGWGSVSEGVCLVLNRIETYVGSGLGAYLAWKYLKDHMGNDEVWRTLEIEANKGRVVAGYVIGMY